MATRPTPVSDRDAHVLLTSILRVLNRVDQTLLRVDQTLLLIKEELAPPPEPASLEMVAQLPNGTVVQGENIMGVINDVQSIPLSLVKFVPDSTAGGKTIEVPVTGPVVWLNSDPTVIELTVSTFSAVAKAVGPNGTATITATADGLTSTDDITVVDSEVASLTIVEGTPTP
jgi:hypothetical protein